jgi:hypothetical protein
VPALVSPVAVVLGRGFQQKNLCSCKYVMVYEKGKHFLQKNTAALNKLYLSWS